MDYYRKCPDCSSVLTSFHEIGDRYGLRYYCHSCKTTMPKKQESDNDIDLEYIAETERLSNVDFRMPAKETFKIKRKVRMRMDNIETMDLLKLFADKLFSPIDTEKDEDYWWSTFVHFVPDCLNFAVQEHHKKFNKLPEYILITENMLADILRWKQSEVGSLLVNLFTEIAFNGWDWSLLKGRFYNMNLILLKPEDKYYSELLKYNRFCLFNLDDIYADSEQPVLKSYMKIQLS